MFARLSTFISYFSNLTDGDPLNSTLLAENCYQVLGVLKTATHEEIVAAYNNVLSLIAAEKNRSKKIHANNLVQAAYELLSDKAQRAAYDAQTETDLTPQVNQINLSHDYLTALEALDFFDRNRLIRLVRERYAHRNFKREGYTQVERQIHRFLLSDNVDQAYKDNQATSSMPSFTVYCILWALAACGISFVAYSTLVFQASLGVVVDLVLNSAGSLLINQVAFAGLAVAHVGVTIFAVVTLAQAVGALYRSVTDYMEQYKPFSPIQTMEVTVNEFNRVAERRAEFRRHFAEYYREHPKETENARKPSKVRLTEREGALMGSSGKMTFLADKEQIRRFSLFRDNTVVELINQGVTPETIRASKEESAALVF